MRRYVKTKCLETLGLLREAHMNLEKLISSRKETEALSLLEQCQQAAISVGNLIEQHECVGTDPIRYLEEYCELAYQLYQSLQSGKTVNHRPIVKKLEKCIHRTVNGIDAFPTRTEAVFLPYKASMWDSLESVWKAADADPNCDAYVIPIPYCDKNPDGSVKEVHYEGALYPDYVPITHYEKYDFEKRHPDMAYIHNPYDEYNFVTSVDPLFYSSSLKSCAEELVYIPYYILAEPPEKLWEWEAEDQEKYLTSLENFAILPGVINADKVILQSEAMKRCFVEILTRHFGKETKKDWEGKILGTGSPKVDKVLNTRVEALEIPVEWQEIIQKPDGTRKKIILYNTGLSAMLKHNEQMLLKIRDVFRVFKENRENVVLLWRPHPLLEATLESMRIELAEVYRTLKAEYLKEGYGIYDDSPDLDRAIILSDAYYGDLSSVVWLYQKTGKPVMIQDAVILGIKE